ncbi:P43 5S RNA-binding protein-like [Gambusia affinis]|uniref:P43 5S RNA-binding protein-like n=1 Tax=Gambusia affinis TaxID=33528 RepID=UPI000F39C795|nr:P43 5S RNA-binding protein-like [Gambusia affinis]
MTMNGFPDRSRLFRCTHADCGATFPREWKLKEHETVHTGARPCLCAIAGCGRSFKRKCHLRRHLLHHEGKRQFQCNIAGCAKAFVLSHKLKRHQRVAHGDKENIFKCSQPNCALSFKKRKMMKLHLQEHNVPAVFKCSKVGCTTTFNSHIARKAHEKKHAGYRCHHDGCQVLEHTWGKLLKHMAKHPATFICSVCKKVFKKAGSLRRHKRSHASHKPVLVCPRENCQAYFSTTFNLEHHIRKVHLQLLKYKCSFPDCLRMFAMRESLQRHLLRHDPTAATMMKWKRPKKTWQKRLNGNSQPFVEENLGRLFALRMRISRRAKVEANLSGLFNERKIPHYVDPEVNLRDLFGIKQPCPLEVLEAAPVRS